MRRILTVFSLCFCVFALPAGAQDGDDERLGVARDIIKLTRATEAVEKMMPVLIDQQMQIIEQQGRTLSANQKQAVEAAVTNFTDSFAQAFAPLMDDMARLYGQKFSLADLKAIRDFYSSDVGARFVDGGLELTPELVQVSQAWTMEHVMPGARKLAADLKAALEDNQ